jgi:hypothetical protein
MNAILGKSQFQPRWIRGDQKPAFPPMDWTQKFPKAPRRRSSVASGDRRARRAVGAQCAPREETPRLQITTIRGIRERANAAWNRRGPVGARPAGWLRGSRRHPRRWERL